MDILNNLLNIRKRYMFIYLVIFLYLVLFFYRLPFLADDWVYSYDWPITNMFQFGGDNSPGRHVSKILTQICTNFLAPVLGILDPMVGLKLSYALMCAIIAMALWFVSAWFIPISSVGQILCVLSLLSVFLPMHYRAPVLTIQIIGGYVLALVSWMPFFYYIKEKKMLPLLGSKNIEILGSSFILSYIGCNVTDLSYWVTCSLSFCFIIYIWIERDTYTHQRKLAFGTAIMHILLGVLSLLRNVIGTGQLAIRKGGITISTVNIYKRIVSGPFWQNISILLGLIIFLYYIYRLICRKKISFSVFFLGVGIFYIFIASIVGTYYTQALWILWVGELCIFFEFCKNKHHNPQFMVSILIFILFIASMRIFKDEKQILLLSNSENRIVEMFKIAQRDALPEIFITHQQIKDLSIDIPITLPAYYTLDSISLVMFKFGYTKARIPLTLVEESNQ